MRGSLCLSMNRTNVEPPTSNVERRTNCTVQSSMFGFMAPMRAPMWMKASHEPENRVLDFQILANFRFMAPEQFKKEQVASHEPGER